MKRLISLGSILILVFSFAAPALACDAHAETTVKGWITDSFCGKNNANAAGAKCTKDCYKNGAKLVLVAGDKTYQISDQKMAFENIGHEVAITGTIEKDTIKVVKIEPSQKNKA